jgi:hypothetical protein
MAWADEDGGDSGFDGGRRQGTDSGEVESGLPVAGVRREREKGERDEEGGKREMTRGPHIPVGPTFFFCVNDKWVPHIFL